MKPTTIIGHDPAYSGPNGLCVRRGDDVHLWAGPLWDATDWLGPFLAERMAPDERAVYVAESTAFGPSVARKLGIAVGVIEGFLVDVNAIEAHTRVDVATKSWRAACPFKVPAGRAAAKAACTRAARAALGRDDVGPDAAEAYWLTEWYRRKRGMD